MDFGLFLSALGFLSLVFSAQRAEWFSFGGISRPIFPVFEISLFHFAFFTIFFSLRPPCLCGEFVLFFVASCLKRSAPQTSNVFPMRSPTSSYRLCGSVAKKVVFPAKR
jgi:hypothetical protein